MRTPIHRTRMLVLAAALLYGTSVVDQAVGQQDKTGTSNLDWPAMTKEYKPWCYWWWLGSAVNKAELTRHLEMYSTAGLGGLHIIPIYGAEGFEDQYIEYLSPKWMDMLAHTTAEAERLGLGIDMSCGTGWPFGGPNVSDADADAHVVRQTFTLAAGEQLKESLDKSALQTLIAFPDKGEPVELLDKVDANGHLQWTAPDGRWELYAISQSAKDGRKVKRAAPGGEGNAANPFSKRAITNYLQRFDKAFADYKGHMPRAFYHDSYEYAGDWTDDLFKEFEARKGYRLQYYLPALFGKGPGDLITRVRSDYRATLAAMHLENFITPWVRWSHERGVITRNQAHGAPGNILDIYAAADIPETEAFGTSYLTFGGLDIPVGMFRTVGGDIPDILVNKMAASAANVTGKRRVTCEAFTWLSDHFRVSPAEAKAALDVLFTLGVNHVTFHGIVYSPKDAGWPGWLFYAETNFGHYNPFWRDMPAFFGYIARCQSFLQAGHADNDTLIYFPIEDIWAMQTGPDQLLVPLQVHNSEGWLRHGARGLHLAASDMWDLGYSFDFVSDKQLTENVVVKGDRLTSGDCSYRALLLPKCKFMQPENMKRIVELARQGATVLVTGALPDDVPGLNQLARRRAALKQILAEIKFEPTTTTGLQQAKVGQGRFLLGNNLQALLETAALRRESMVDLGIEFIRREDEHGWIYFITNPGRRTVDQWLPLSVPAATAAIFNPMTNRSGLADIRRGENGRLEVYLQLVPGVSRIIRAFKADTQGPRWVYAWPAGVPREIHGPWQVKFIEGGPTLPPPLTIERLKSWTDFDPTEAGAAYSAFSGTARYTVSFDKPEGAADDWMLELGQVCHTAKIRLNGQDLGTLFSQPYRIALGQALKDKDNLLEIESTNLAANRIIDMERRGEKWAKYLFMYINRANTTPADWQPFPSGLLGPVRLVPMKVSP